MSQNFARSFTVQQSVQPSEKQIPINVTLVTPGVAQDVILIGGSGDALECVREFDLVVSRDCFISLHGDATISDIPLKAGDAFCKKNIIIRTDHSTKEAETKISIINAKVGQKPNIRGMVGGY